MDAMMASMSMGAGANYSEPAVAEEPGVCSDLTLGECENLTVARLTQLKGLLKSGGALRLIFDKGNKEAAKAAMGTLLEVHTSLAVIARC